MNTGGETVMEDSIRITTRDVEREARWLRVAGHAFAATLMEAMWAELNAGRLDRPSPRAEESYDGK